MRNTVLFGFMVILLAFGFLFGCSNGTTDPPTPQPKVVVYQSTDAAGNTYKLTITENLNRSAYAVQPGDTYVLEITSLAGVTRTSTGTVQSVAGDTIILLPSGTETPFIVTISDGTMTGISGPEAEPGPVDEPETFTVTFNSNGGTAVPAKTGISPGSTITLPEEPTRDCHFFRGWFTDNETFMIPFTASTPVTQNIIVYAKWEFDESFYDNPGLSTSNPDAGALSAHGLTLDQFNVIKGKAEGYLGWSVNSEGEPTHFVIAWKGRGEGSS